MALQLPEKMEFTMGSTEEKMDMTLDDIIKQNRKVKSQRVPNKGPARRSGGTRANGGATPASRAAIQRSVAARSSNLRQGKFAVARARNGAGTFAATQAAGKRASAMPVARRKGVWARNGDGRRSNIRKQGGAARNLNQFGGGNGNMTVSGVNNGSRAGGQRFYSAPLRRRNGSNGSSRHAQNEQPRIDRMDFDHPQNSQPQIIEARTSDYLFEDFEERDNNQRVVVQSFASEGRRGGRNGFQGRRRRG